MTKAKSMKILLASAWMLVQFSGSFAHAAGGVNVQSTMKSAQEREAKAQLRVLESRRKGLLHEGFKPWTWQESDCQSCELAILISRPEIMTPKVEAFVAAVARHKQDLMEIYEVSGEEYNLLAHMAIGILGRESLFFTSSRYKMKESLQGAVTLAKVISLYLEGSESEPSLNSRGPTQIKIVPQAIAIRFGVTADTLRQPEDAALATMGYLIEALGELKRRIVKNDLDFINPSNYADYLPYIYFGSTRSLINRTATPDQNIYIRDMRMYMSWVELYERDTSVGSPQSWHHGVPELQRQVVQ